MIPQKISNCSITSIKSGRADKNSCLSKQYINLISSKLGAKSNYENVLRKTGCTNDQCLINKAGSIAPEETTREKFTAFKIDGPTDKKLLSNFNIDTVLRQWETHFDGTAHGNDAKFFAYNFNMKEWKTKSWSSGRVLNEPDTLESIKFEQLYYPQKSINRKGEVITDKSFNCAGCVVNTDSYYGGGKHWMAIFIDWRDSKAGWTVEFFNSSGNNPSSSWVEFLVSMTSQMKTVASREGISPKVEYIVVNRKRMQKSKSECGLYSLFYIWSRINNFTHEHFQKYAIRDRYMYEFRQHIFNGTPQSFITKDGNFDWDAFKKSIRLEWEAGTTEEDKA